MAGPESVFAEHRDDVLRYLRRIVGPDAARDLTQEVFLRVSRHPIPEGRDGQRAWVFRIARNLALNYRRDERRRPVSVELADLPRSPSQEVVAAVRQALNNLSPQDRNVFLMREVSGLTYDEIADECKLSSDAVRSRLHRARQQLRTVLVPGRSNAVPISIRVRLDD